MVALPISVGAPLGCASAFFENSTFVGPDSALIVFGRQLMCYLPMTRTNGYAGVSVYPEQMLAGFAVIRALSEMRAQTNRPPCFSYFRVVLVAILRMLVQSVVTLVPEASEAWNCSYPGDVNRSASVDPFESESLVANPHHFLNDLLGERDTRRGFVAVDNGGCFVVVASLNSVPIGHQLGFVGGASMGPLATSMLGAIVVPNAGRDMPLGRPDAYPDHVFERMVEQALKGLSDYGLLGQSGLVSQLRLDPTPRLEQAKALRRILIDAIEGLRPASVEPKGLPPREWHAYVILHDAYVEHVPNRDIMSRLYISEGTFNRQRRKALRAVAATLWEARNPETTVLPESDLDYRLMELTGQLSGSTMLPGDASGGASHAAHPVLPSFHSPSLVDRRG